MNRSRSEGLRRQPIKLSLISAQRKAAAGEGRSSLQQPQSIRAIVQCTSKPSAIRLRVIICLSVPTRSPTTSTTQNGHISNSTIIATSDGSRSIRRLSRMPWRARSHPRRRGHLRRSHGQHSLGSHPPPNVGMGHHIPYWHGARAREIKMARSHPNPRNRDRCTRLLLGTSS